MSTAKKILVTGAAGNIGSSLVKKLVQDPANEVIAVDNLSTGSLAKLPGGTHNNFSFIQADVNDYEVISRIMQATDFNYVFHYAAVVGVARTLENPISVLRDIEGIRNIFELAKNSTVSRVFYASSSEVYGEPVAIPQHEETTPLNSRLPYAVVKNVGESFCKSYLKEFGLPYTIFRFFNTYGPSQSQDFVLPRFLDAALKNKPITVYGDGSQTRTFCYVTDNIDTTITALEKEIGINDTINIGSDEEVTILQLAETIIRLTGSQSIIKHLPPLPEGDMTRRFPDLAKMKAILPRPLTTLEEGINKMLAAL